MTSDILNNNTPVEKYSVAGRNIFVKREDLSTSWPAPSLAKLRGCLLRMISLKENSVTSIGVFDTRISKSAWGVAYLASKLGGISVDAYYPEIKAEAGQLHQQQFMAKKLGAILHPMKGGRTAVLYSRAKREVENNGNYMMPLGLVVEESVDAIAAEANTIPENFLGGDLVVCTGSGMTLAGIIKGIASKQHHIYGISAGMNTQRQIRRINSVNVEIPENVSIILPENCDYYSQENISVPFPSSVYYDRKAWKWLLENLEILREPTIFWNIGV